MDREDADARCARHVGEANGEYVPRTSMVRSAIGRFLPDRVEAAILPFRWRAPSVAELSECMPRGPVHPPPVASPVAVE